MCWEFLYLRILCSISMSRSCDCDWKIVCQEREGMCHQCVSNGSQGDLVSLHSSFYCCCKKMWEMCFTAQPGSLAPAGAFGESTPGTQGWPSGWSQGIADPRPTTPPLRKRDEQYEAVGAASEPSEKHSSSWHHNNVSLFFPLPALQHAPFSCSMIPLTSNFVLFLNN